MQSISPAPGRTRRTGGPAAGGKKKEFMKMKVRINETDLNGNPIHDSGEILNGDSHLDIVDGMKMSPFTAGLEPLAYMRDVLARSGAPDFPLPDEPEAAAKAFLLKLAATGLVQFIEDDPYPPRLMEPILAIRDSGKTNMLDIPTVVYFALESGEDEVANWINIHHRDYAEIIFHGRPANHPTDEVK